MCHKTHAKWQVVGTSSGTKGIYWWLILVFHLMISYLVDPLNIQAICLYISMVEIINSLIARICKITLLIFITLPLIMPLFTLYQCLNCCLDCQSKLIVTWFCCCLVLDCHLQWDANSNTSLWERLNEHHYITQQLTGNQHHCVELVEMQSRHG